MKAGCLRRGACRHVLYVEAFLRARDRDDQRRENIARLPALFLAPLFIYLHNFFVFVQCLLLYLNH